jgi:chromosomal replication initiator protein
MIAQHLEPKGLAPDAEPLGETYKSALFRENAERGSAMLRDAILRSQGIVIPFAPRRPRPAPTMKLATLCPTCHAPVKLKHPMIAHVQATVAAYFEIPLHAMTGARQTHDQSHPRQIAMFLAHELTDKSISEIGRRFNKDHTTVIHAIRAVEKRIAADPEVEFDVEVLRERLSA